MPSANHRGIAWGYDPLIRDLDRFDSCYHDQVLPAKPWSSAMSLSVVLIGVAVVALIVAGVVKYHKSKAAQVAAPAPVVTAPVAQSAPTSTSTTDTK